MGSTQEPKSELPSVAVSIAGQVYRLCVDLGALAEAETHFNLQGHQVELLTAIPEIARSAPRLREALPCGLRKFHPELGFKPAQQLVTMGSYLPIVTSFALAWPAITQEAAEANANLCFDLLALADAEEHFAGQVGHEQGSLRKSVTVGPSLAALRNIFPCALHRFRPDLSFVEGQQLMHLQSAYVVALGMPAAFRASSERVRQEFGDRLLARASWSRVAHA